MKWNSSREDSVVGVEAKFKFESHVIVDVLMTSRLAVCTYSPCTPNLPRHPDPAAARVCTACSPIPRIFPPTFTLLSLQCARPCPPLPATRHTHTQTTRPFPLLKLRHSSALSACRRHSPRLPWPAIFLVSLYRP